MEGKNLGLNDLLLDINGAVATVTLNKPKSLNALTLEMRNNLALLFEDLDKNPLIRSIVLTGAGNKAFSAGLDLNELSQDNSTLKSIYDSSNFRDPVDVLTNLDKPVVCAVNGVAITGGFELAINCDIVLGSENAAFADTHANVGVLPAWGLSYRLSQAIGSSRAKELSFSGRFIHAEEALSWGLINSIHDQNKLIDYAQDLASKIANFDPKFIREYKTLIDEGARLRENKSAALERRRSAEWNLDLTTSTLKKNITKMLHKK